MTAHLLTTPPHGHVPPLVPGLPQGRGSWASRSEGVQKTGRVESGGAAPESLWVAGSRRQPGWHRSGRPEGLRKGAWLSKEGLENENNKQIWVKRGHVTTCRQACQARDSTWKVYSSDIMQQISRAQ